MPQSQAGAEQDYGHSVSYNGIGHEKVSPVLYLDAKY